MNKEKLGDLITFIEGIEPKKKRSPAEWEALLSKIAFTLDSDLLRSFVKSMSVTDYFEAPASTRFHGAFQTGLVQHSLLTAYYLLRAVYYYIPEKEYLSIDQYVLAGLAHDLCKVNTYEVDFRNVKTEKGEWVKQPYFKTREHVHSMGHGVESIWQLRNSPYGGDICPSVYTAIRWHMGTWDVSDSEDYAWHEAQTADKLVLLLELADRQAASWEGI